MSSSPLFPVDPPSDQPPPPPPPQLKLFTAPAESEEAEAEPDHGVENVSADMTLPEFWEEFYKPVRLTGRSWKTLKEDRSSLKKWRAYAGDRPIKEISRKLLSDFVGWLQQNEKLKLITAAKHLGRIQSFLRAAGPDTDGEGLCAEVLPRVQRVKPPSVPQRVPDKAFQLKEIGRWLDACCDARPMRRVACPPAWWQSIVLFDYFCPVRFEALTAARWEWLWLRTIDDRAGWWLNCPAEFDKNDCEQDYYVSSHALSAIEILAPAQLASLRRGEPVAGPIWGLPITPAKIGVHARRLLNAAGLSAERHEERVFHGLRAAADTELRKLGYPVAAKRALGRAVGNDVDMGFYTGLEEYVRAMELMPVPTFNRWREPQLRLFD